MDDDSILNSALSTENANDIGPTSKKYKIRKWLSVITCCLCYVIAYFHRFTPAVLAKMIAPDFGVSISDLGFFTSMFFWSYGLLQPFVGSLADVFEIRYTITISLIIALIGSLLCGLAQTLTMCSIGRLLVGVGCAAVYVSTNKVAANWFNYKEFRFFAGAVIGVGGLGSILSQSPLQMLGTIIGWRKCFIVVSIAGLVFAIMAFAFVRSHPSKCGLVGYNTLPPRGKPCDEILQVFKNLKMTAMIPDFWLISTLMFFGPGFYMDVTGLYGVPFLTDVFHYSNSVASNCQMSLSLSVIVGSPLIPVIAELIHRRKLTIIIFASISITAAATLACLDYVSPIYACILFFCFGFGCTGPQGIMMGFFKELSSGPSLEGTLLGFGNCFSFIGGSIFPLLTSGFVKTYPHSEHSLMVPESLRIGLWGLAIVSLTMLIYSTLFVRERK
ncbi:Major Facilitator Superfamily protein [Trichomonas vaginalis G3]|uniref:Lysosomal dipeptide transporter MFSD1 n=1 Tax=Trichomonas vaginalis (strain ATCC PRA-98 / G3) TaxID=412133 RepID=A2EBA7_TRIV3|nr:major facilitator superfamily transporter [Trichomonas vaginalis G3]EAY10052.1 Major Facilitator Superfamily protein [Trichomonas vaginalis G3]KAI5528498.1 Major Facilitator Superfamily [Trichomonas vaginalis G3]|eukprot:XP_001322275.1 major facilitator superfamily transporter [Trichomonas vaginalis G3]